MRSPTSPPRPAQALDELGYRGFWMGYFAARSAPLGVVPAQVVAAIFYNFAPERVSRALPAAWQIAGPADALRARERSAVAALRRCGVTDDDENVRVAARLAAKAAGRAAVDGRPLFAANAALPWPDDPVALLWHGVTLLREHRGDGHVAALTVNGISGRESNVLHAAAGKVDPDYIARTRDYDQSSWNTHRQRLADRGLLTADGALTTAGLRLKDHIENTTDKLACRALDALDDDEVEALFRALTPLTRLVVAAGDVPADTPMGLRRHDLADDGAHL